MISRRSASGINEKLILSLLDGDTEKLKLWKRYFKEGILRKEPDPREWAWLKFKLIYQRTPSGWMPKAEKIPVSESRIPLLPPPPEGDFFIVSELDVLDPEQKKEIPIKERLIAIRNSAISKIRFSRQIVKEKIEEGGPGSGKHHNKPGRWGKHIPKTELPQQKTQTQPEPEKKEPIAALKAGAEKEFLEFVRLNPEEAKKAAEEIVKIFADAPKTYDRSATAWRRKIIEKYKSDKVFAMVVNGIISYTHGWTDHVRAGSLLAAGASREEAARMVNLEYDPQVEIPLEYEVMKKLLGFEQEKDIGVIGIELGKVLNEMIDIAPKTKNPIYRGAYFWRDVDIRTVAKLKPGDEFDVIGVSSFSHNENVARDFAYGVGGIFKSKKPGEAIKAKRRIGRTRIAPDSSTKIIFVAHNAPGINVAALSTWKQEEILTRGRFRIVKNELRDAWQSELMDVKSRRAREREYALQTTGKEPVWLPKIGRQWKRKEFRIVIEYLGPPARTGSEIRGA